MTRSEDALLTVKEYAAIVRKDPETVRRSIRGGHFKWPIERETPTASIRIRVPASWLQQMSANYDASHLQG